ncbi:hypothetical protein [Leptospira noguchii]|uniref:hypothetical protein n=1 Tax=Leptospira noguchii TaxID=28182 RepID=UPI000248AAD7
MITQRTSLGKKPIAIGKVPLNWVTLGIWGLTPFYYPCIVKESKDDVQAENNRKIRIVNSLKKLLRLRVEYGFS